MSTPRRPNGEIFALLRNPDIDDKYDEIKSLIEPDSSELQIRIYNNRNLPIHVAVYNPHVTLRVVQLLMNGWPESISQPNRYGVLPLHYLCGNKELDETVSVDILKILIEVSPESVQREASGGELPIHKAAWYGMSPEFLKILVHAYPEPARIPRGDDRKLPIHLACESDNCRLDSVEYLLDIYPESIDVEDSSGWLAIHHVARNNGPQKAEIIEYFLSKDPTCASKATEHGLTPLHLACNPLHFANSSNPTLTAIQLLFDAFPEAVLKRDNARQTPLDRAENYRVDTDTGYSEDDIAYLNSQKAQVINFLRTQQFYANSSSESLAVQDENGWTRLHRALKSNAPLGSIKLLVKKSVDTLQMADRNMAFPLHIACEFSSVKVVQYLMDMLDEHTRNHLDANKDSILHYACRGGNCEVVKYLLDKQSPHIAERNAGKKLPIQLFCESGSSMTNTVEGDPQTNTGEDIVNDIAWICDICQVAKFRTLDEAEAHEERCSGVFDPVVKAYNDLDRTDTIYRLLLAYPETVREYI